MEEELLAPLEHVFDEFEPQPFAAATGFQLHRADLRREKVWVAVKVLRPYAAEFFASDFAVIRRFTRWFRRVRWYPRMRWGDLLHEIHEAMVRELDLRYEATSLNDLRRTLPRHGIYVPQVFTAYSSPRVLVMEYIHGALVADYIALRQTDPRRLARWLAENRICPRRVARRLFGSVWRQVFEDNLFHADMSPYNVVLLRNSRLAVLDCRSVGSFEAENLVKHRMFMRALAEGFYATAAERSFVMAIRLPQVDLGEVRAQFIRVWRRWESRSHVRGLPPAEKSLTRMFDGLNRVMYRYNFEVDWSLARFAWTVVNADISLLELAPDINYLRWLRSYFRQADRRARQIDLDQQMRQTSAVWCAGRYAEDGARDEHLAAGHLPPRARLVQGTTAKSGYFVATVYDFLAAAVLMTGLLLGAAMLGQHAGVAFEPWAGRQLAAAVGGAAGVARGAFGRRCWRWRSTAIGVLRGCETCICGRSYRRHTRRV